MESTGAKNKVHLSADTAKLLIQQGRQSWVIQREGTVHVKGKGECQTYWLSLGSSSGSHTGSTSSDEKSVEGGALHSIRRSSHSANNLLTSSISKKGGSWAGTFFDGVLGVTQIDDKLSRLVDWNVEVLAGLLKRIVARNIATEAIRGNTTGDAVSPQAFEKSSTVGADVGTARDEIKMVVSLPGFDKKVVELAYKEQVTLDPQVVHELREYVTAIATGYTRENEFHNFEHASHVILSANKLMKRIVAPSEVGPDQKSELTAREVYEYTYGKPSPVQDNDCRRRIGPM
jgi:HSP20 family molecular chaperone IbpA